ncbi:lysozyme [Microvirga arsenatis]|uniref:Lysozyme n=1 Tax=Microvirga arsenatis TaxID=2692265 RepID=A0ABW9Z3J2_9HYPH|nr:lysozyme [Microvirga arsenatis]NBJ13188.1 glycoside hydrolase family protein [Microvirga arsenatis]NBJ25174.1 glycoside hydrolase family protein [Microvirga arsenatis]
MGRVITKRRSAAAVALCMTFTGGWEGVQTFAYPDPATKGHPWTICYGETEGVKKGDRRTIEECKEGLRKGIEERYGAAVDACTKVAITDRQWVAFTSFAWNLGTGRYCKSIAPLVNAGNIRAACDKLMEFVYANKIKFRGLVRRRAAERELCMADL